jgi:histidinol-phosphatase (PHP family)
MAISEGLREIGFSEHYDLIPADEGFGFFDPERWWAELARCREMFKGALTIRAGIEIGEPHRFPHEVGLILDKYDWDYVIGSLHWIGDDLVFDPDYYSQPETEAYGRYLAELQQMVKDGSFDILGHLDIVKRYGHDYYGPFDPSPFEAQFRALFQECIRRRITIEVNTSTLRRPLREICPHPQLLRWYRQEGGYQVCLGSDAHSEKEIGFGFDQAVRSLKQVDIQAVVAFRLRKRTYMRLSPRSDVT